MNRLNCFESCEVTGIECQNPADAMDVHRCHQLCIVDLDAQNTVLDDQAFPLSINRRRVWQDRQEPLDFLNLSKGQCNGESEAVVGCGPGSDIPKLGNILEREIYRLAGFEQLCDTLNGYGVAWMIGLGAPQQDVRIDQDAHLA